MDRQHKNYPRVPNTAQTSIIVENYIHNFLLLGLFDSHPSLTHSPPSPILKLPIHPPLKPSPASIHDFFTSRYLHSHPTLAPPPPLISPIPSTLDDDRPISPRNQPNLPRNNRSRLNRRSMMSGQLSINRHILIQVRQHLLRARRVPPVPHQITHNRKQRVHLHASLGHLRVGGVAHEGRGRARRFNVGEDGIPGGAQTEGEEGGADVGGYAGEDYLGAVGGFDGGAEGGVVPGAGR
jgi:hypothetical protein